ncbi:Uncharacterised protein [Kingella potus]|uniref:Uncharacterized protein n=1 Tax=Kingella potus TaxID=265175 RepID=A0A377R292_9NEIS|nr:hypothetical protein [Kingella potus]UOP01172.1 hypothetical protein LVJ84_02335 [Kingella potus]STR00878.1 Uncharacterised protein [Kingella potus]
MRQSSLFFPLLLITVGAAWFLKTTDILPATSTMIAIGLAAFGILVPLTDGINKQSVVAGPLLIYCGAAVYLHSEYQTALSPLTAFGMMVLGCLLLLSRSSLIPYKTVKQPPQ